MRGCEDVGFYEKYGKGKFILCLKKKTVILISFHYIES